MSESQLVQLFQCAIHRADPVMVERADGREIVLQLVATSTSMDRATKTYQIKIPLQPLTVRMMPEPEETAGR